jgi:hypothetical protein
MCSRLRASGRHLAETTSLAKQPEKALGAGRSRHHSRNQALTRIVRPFDGRPPIFLFFAAFGDFLDVGRDVKCTGLCAFWVQPFEENRIRSVQ